MTPPAGSTVRAWAGMSPEPAWGRGDDYDASFHLLTGDDFGAQQVRCGAEVKVNSIVHVAPGRVLPGGGPICEACLAYKERS